MSKMTIAGLQRLSASSAFVCFAGDAHAPIEGPIFSIGATFVEIKQSAISEFDLGLVYYVLVRPAESSELCPVPREVTYTRRQTVAL